MTTGLCISAVEARRNSDLQSTVFQKNGDGQDSKSARIVPSQNSHERDKYKNLMRIQTPISIDKALNDIMNTRGASPHISNEPYPLYDEQRKSFDHGLKSEVNGQQYVPPTAYNQGFTSMNQTAIGFITENQRSRQKTPNYSISDPKSQIETFKRFGIRKRNQQMANTLRQPLFNE